MLVYVGLFLLSAASLAFEIILTRVFSVAQFYHFAFMVVSLALLGFGASGTFLSLFPGVERGADLRVLSRLGWLFALTAVGSYLLTLFVPFDSFRIVRDWRQIGVLLLHYVALAAPFFCSGAAVGLLLAVRPQDAGRVYAANLTGSAAGCVLAVAAPPLVGGEGVILLCAALGLVAAFLFRVPTITGIQPGSRFTTWALSVFQVFLVALLLFGALRTPGFFHIRLSPYKSLSYLLQYPDAQRVFQGWNGFSRVDVVRSSSIRGLPGSGFRCAAEPPRQMGLTVDGDDLNYISQVEPDFTELPFTDCLLMALPYRLRPDARVLVLEPRGGLDVLTALAQGASAVTVAEPNPLIVQSVRQEGDWAGDLYDDPRVEVVVEQGRTYARRTRDRYEVLTLSLHAPQRTVTSGAYSLNEDYRYTVEAFSDYLGRLREDGLLVATRWLQVPPSESIRAFALAVEAMERTGGDPKTSIVALRSYRQMLILVRRGSFTEEELAAVRDFAEPRAFDLVYLPDIRPHEVNRHNVLPSPDYHQAFVGLLETEDRQGWYGDYPFDVEPPTDDRPFFGHFFRWTQTRDVLAMAGHTWQPFGGAGYFVMLILLALAVVAAGALILAPVAALRRQGGTLGWTSIYFALLGVGYLFVEIPLMQRFILFLGHPAYALAVVLFAILLFSGVGSAVSHRLSLRLVLALLPALIGAYVLGLPSLFRATLALPLWVRMVVAVATLAPPGFLMGIPLPKGIALLEERSSSLIAWAWGVNGAVSVVASILAALLALSFGFSVALILGAACYAAALRLTAASLRPPRSPGSPSR
jgi:spermidine synthase